VATRCVFTPLSAEFPTSNFPQLLLVNRRPVLAFDASTDETAYWTAVVPQGFTGTPSVTVSFIMASATSGNVVFQAAIEAVTSGDALDLDTATSFDTANSSGAVSVPTTAGYMKQFSITLMTNDSMAAADYFRLSLNRDADNANDTAAGDCYVLAVELRDGA